MTKITFPCSGERTLGSSLFEPLLDGVHVLRRNIVSNQMILEHKVLSKVLLIILSDWLNVTNDLTVLTRTT